ncbi:MAG: helix-turn-helix domain-containing protein [Oscillospiraceae bacterium]|nr:helix-turn-helix domain-containing protein [Oscillospiraceae bacterium]
MLLPDDSERLVLDLSDPERVSLIARALSVPKRLEILRLLGEKNVMSVNEISQTLNIPISSTSTHISILEEAKLIVCERMSSIRGTMKMCTRVRESILFHLCEDPPHRTKQYMQSMPIGAYSQAESITSPCGLASQLGPIGIYNKPSCFYLPERLDAQVLWVQSGCLCYRFAPLLDNTIEPEYLELSFEACTEARVDTPDWHTEIRITINGCLLGGSVCSSDTEGRRGKLNPPWWPDVSTQYGELQKWRVTKNGTYLNDVKISNVKLGDLKLNECSRINVLLHVPSDSHHAAGLNLFGTGFGDYNQAIQLVIGYQSQE